MTQEELQRLTITDLLESEAYRKRMTQMLNAAWKCEKERRKNGGKWRTLIVKLRERGITTGERFATVFHAILNKGCELPASMRMEIMEVGSSIARVILNEWQEEVTKEQSETPVNQSKT